MNPAKKRIIGDESRVFNQEWMHTHIFSNTSKKAVFLLCHQTIAVFKEYNLKRHYKAKHNVFGGKLSEDERKKKCAYCVTNLNKQQTFF